MNAVDASAINTMLNTCNCVGFAPALNYLYGSSAKTVTVTDASTFSSGDAFKRVNVDVFDYNGKSVKGTISAATGNTGALDVSGLDLSRPLNIKATVSSTGGCVSDGSAWNITPDVSLPLGSFDREFTGSEAANISAPTTLS